MLNHAQRGMFIWLYHGDGDGCINYPCSGSSRARCGEGKLTVKTALWKGSGMWLGIIGNKLQITLIALLNVHFAGMKDIYRSFINGACRTSSP